MSRNVIEWKEITKAYFWTRMMKSYLISLSRYVQAEWTPREAHACSVSIYHQHQQLLEQQAAYVKLGWGEERKERPQDSVFSGGTVVCSVMMMMQDCVCVNVSVSVCECVEWVCVCDCVCVNFWGDAIHKSMLGETVRLKCCSFLNTLIPGCWGMKAKLWI